jgi:O-antigen/teichoic acid export membrane protein
MLLFVFTRLLGAVLSVQKAISLVGTNFISIDFSEWKLIINQIMIYGIHFIFGNLFFQLDTILIGIWKSDNDVGIYKSAFNIALLILIISDIAFSSLLPVLSRLYYENLERWKNFCRLYFKVFFLASLPITIVVYFCAEQIISILYGTKLYNEAVPILKIFSIIIFFRFIGEPYAMMLTTSRRQYFRMIIVIVATFASFVINYFVIPKYGILGAAFVSIGINILVCLAYISANKLAYMSWIFESRILAVLSLAAIMIFILSYNQALSIALILTIIYVPLAYLVGFSKNDRQGIAEYFNLKKVLR